MSRSLLLFLLLLHLVVLTQAFPLPPSSTSASASPVPVASHPRSDLAAFLVDLALLLHFHLSARAPPSLSSQYAHYILSAHPSVTSTPSPTFRLVYRTRISTTILPSMHPIPSLSFHLPPSLHPQHSFSTSPSITPSRIYMRALLASTMLVSRAALTPPSTEQLPQVPAPDVLRHQSYPAAALPAAEGTPAYAQSVPARALSADTKDVPEHVWPVSGASVTAPDPTKGMSDVRASSSMSDRASTGMSDTSDMAMNGDITTQVQREIPMGPFRGVKDGVVNGQNLTHLSMMTYKVALSQRVLTMAAAPCHTTRNWLPAVIARLQQEVMGFEFFCVDTTTRGAYLPELKNKFGILANEYEIGEVDDIASSLQPEIDLVISWMGIQEWGTVQGWSFFKGLRRAGVKSILIGNYAVKENPESGSGRVNVRKAPLFFNEAKRVIGKVGEDPKMQMLLYDLHNIRDEFSA